MAVDGAERARIGPGLLVLLGVARDDDAADAARLAGKVARLRVFEDEDGPLRPRACSTPAAPALVVSQFTLLADTAKGNRPSFSDAAPPERGGAALRARSAPRFGELGVPVETGVFGARMQVELVNDGPGHDRPGLVAILTRPQLRTIQLGASRPFSLR